MTARLGETVSENLPLARLSSWSNCPPTPKLRRFVSLFKSQISFGILPAIAALHLDRMNTTEIEITKMPAFSFFAFPRQLVNRVQSWLDTNAARYLTRGTKRVKKGGQKGGHSWFISLKHAILFRPA
jgi:hypothetical protein